jgi:ketosteroid isomerase-like protein
MLTSIFAQAQSTAQDEVLQATRTWLQSVSKGDRAGLNAIMDALCIITTPAGDVLTKERLVPNDPALAVQRLPALDLDSPMVRLYGDTAVLMARLKSTAGDGQVMNGTFVYNKRDGAWKLVAIHLSLQK